MIDTIERTILDSKNVKNALFLVINSDFLILLSLQPSLRYFKLCIMLNQIIYVRNIRDLHLSGCEHIEITKFEFGDNTQIF